MNVKCNALNKITLHRISSLDLDFPKWRYIHSHIIPQCSMLSIEGGGEYTPPSPNKEVQWTRYQVMWECLYHVVLFSLIALCNAGFHVTLVLSSAQLYSTLPPQSRTLVSSRALISCIFPQHAPFNNKRVTL